MVDYAKNRIGDGVMKYIIYIDVFFMVNIVMDLVLLEIAAFYIKPQTTFIRCLAGAAVGSLLTCVTLLISYDNMMIHMLSSYIFIVAAMVIVAYGKCSIRQMIKRAGWLYFVTIIMGGAMNLVYDYTYFGYVLRGIFSTVYTNPVNIIRLIGFTGIAYIILLMLTRYISNMRNVNELVMVNITMKGKSVTLKGLIDTGNSLKDPYTGKYVHIAEYKALQRILEGVDIHREKYRLVPYHSLGKRNGLVEVIEFDEITIRNSYSSDNGVCQYEQRDEEKTVTYTEKNPAIGLYYGALSGEKKYEMLLNRCVSDQKG